MADEDVGQPELVLQLVEQVQHLRLHRHVERRDRLVEHDHLRLRGERPRDADALRLSAGEFVRVALQELAAQPYRVHQRIEPRGALRLSEAEKMAHRRLQRLADGLARVERGDRVLEDVLNGAGKRVRVAARQPGDVGILQADAPAGRPVEPHQHARQRRLPAAGFADHAQRLALAQLQVDALHGVDRRLGAAEQSAPAAEAALQVLCDEHGLAHHAASPAASG